MTPSKLSLSNNYDILFEMVLYQLQHGIAIGSNSGMYKVDLHHAFVHNTKPNRKNFPFLIDSPFNLWGLSHMFHIANPNWKPFKLSEMFLTLIEDSLKRFDEAIKTNEKSFAIIYSPFQRWLKHNINFDNADDEKLFIHRLEASFRWIWNQRG